MDKDILTKIINKIKEYNLTKHFDNKNDFKEWIKSLNAKQINNFINLNIKKSEFEFPSSLLINNDLLNCDDYNKRVEALSKLHNGDGCWHLFGALVSPNFLYSNKWYKDVEMISQAEEARYCLWIIDDDAFIKSPYHDEDLKLIVEAKDTSIDEYGNPREYDFAIAASLAETAKCIESINSPYHQEDMNLIAHAGSDKVQGSNSYPKMSIDCLARNEISLKDKYHNENMQILLNSKLNDANCYIYNLFTNSDVINSKYYDLIRKTIKNIDEDITMIALYYYILDDKNLQNHTIIDIINEYNLNTSIKSDIFPISYYYYDDEIKLNQINPNHLELIASLNNPIVLYIKYLLTNENFLNSPYLDYDLKFILTNYYENTNYENLNIIVKILTNINFINSQNHIKDLEIINSAKDKETIYNLSECATNEYNINSINHDYDMKYILENSQKRLSNNMKKYIFNEKYINSTEHIECLEKLAKGIKIDDNSFLNSVDEIYKYINNDDITEEKTYEKESILKRVKSFFK